jgi:hypothetical protein
VEPVPEFYRRFGRLCERYTEVLDRAGAFAEDGPASRRAIEGYGARDALSVELLQLEDLMAILEKAQVAKRGAEGFKKLPGADLDRARALAKALRQDDPAGLERPDQFGALLDRLRE